jgi:hypothetical protein
MDAPHLQAAPADPYAKSGFDPYLTKSKASTPQHPLNSKAPEPSAQSRGKLQEVTPYYRRVPNLFEIH